MQLGMPLGTASNRLRKEIMFYLAKQLNKNVCFRCGNEILTSSEFSIEHKIDWLDSDKPQELFFDIENIAFSHLKCNIRYARKNTSKTTHRYKVKNGLHYLCKLTEADAIKIRELSKTLKGTTIAKMFNVSKHTIYRVINNKSFK